MGLTDLFVARSSRSFRTGDDPRLARRVVDDIRLRDAAPGGLPPGVVGGRSGPGHFNAASPFAAFDADLRVAPDGRGGSLVTEHKVAFSPIPGVAWVANAIHDLATHPDDAYERSRRRR